MNRTSTLSLVMLFAASAMPVQAFEITHFSGAIYSPDTSSMDTLLGITGYTIENFEDVVLVPGLSISYTNPNFGPVNVLPTVYNEAAVGNYINNLWDGSHALVNTPQNQEWNQPGIGLGSLVDRITFHLDGGATSFGIGFGNFQSDLVDHELLVNGVSQVSAIETLPGWISGINTRNGYIRIDAEPGELINSVSFDIGIGTRDGLIFDRLAFTTAVPEPSSLLGVLAFGAFGIGSRLKRKQQSRNRDQQ